MNLTYKIEQTKLTDMRKKTEWDRTHTTGKTDQSEMAEQTEQIQITQTKLKEKTEQTDKTMNRKLDIDIRSYHFGTTD